MCRWREALGATLEIAHPILGSSTSPRLCLIGSAATALHGIDVEPGDIDFLASEPAIVREFADIMKGYAQKDRVADRSEMNGRWLSSVEEPILADAPNPKNFVWHFGRWLVGGFKVEVANIVPPEGMALGGEAGVWEAGPGVWRFVRLVTFDEGSIPAVPLELQLQTNMARGLEDRVVKIVDYFSKHGYDRDVLGACLSKKNMDKFRTLLEMHGGAARGEPAAGHL